MPKATRQDGQRTTCQVSAMNNELKDLSPAQVAVRIAFACGVTALVAVSVFYAILWLAGGR
jgi:hypothetical protein